MILQGEIERQNHYYYEFDKSSGVIGQGGMGVVYKGHMVDETTGAYRDVAIKEIKTEGSAEEQSIIVDRAKREASIRLNNDNVVEMMGFVEVHDKRLSFSKIRYYVVSEFLEGVTLDKVLEGNCQDYMGKTVYYAQNLYAKYQNDRENTAAVIIRNVLSAIMALHDRGYIHRDIDPSNIMITSDGRIKLFDLGIAKQVGTLLSSDDQRERGSFVGKVEYAAPELLSGQIEEQDFTTDIYAIGVLFYKLLTGRLPFDGNRFEIQQGHMNRKPDLKKIKSQRYRAVISMAMEKNKDKRFKSSAAMRSALDGDVPRPQPVYRWIMPLIASIVVIPVVLVIAYQHREEKPDQLEQDQLGREVQKMIIDSDIQIKEEVDTIRIDAYLNAGIEEVWEKLKVDPHDPCALYAVSKFVSNSKFNKDESFRIFWKDVFVKDGDCESYCKGNRSYSSVRFRFSALCRAASTIVECKYTINGKVLYVDGADELLKEIKNMQEDKKNGGNNLTYPKE